MLSTSNLISTTTESHIYPDANGKRSVLPLSSPVILRIDIHHEIGGKNLTAADIQDIQLDSRENLLGNGRVKGILLHFDTPGGTVTDADDIYRLLLAYKKKYNVPIYGYIEGLCASGGVYLGAVCEQLYASPTSIIGSVGVRMGPAFNVSQTMEKVGVQAVTITGGKDKDVFNPFRPWKPGEDDSLRIITSLLYDRFVDVVTAARTRIDKQKLIDVYGAQVYIAAEAEAIGFIDHGNSSYDDALSALALASGIHETQPYQVIQLKKSEKFFDQLVGSDSGLLSGKITHHVDLGHPINAHGYGKFLYLY